MPTREGNRTTNLATLTNELAQQILAMDLGSQHSIAKLVHAYYTSRGYESKHLGIDLGYSYTKDGGKTFVNDGMDMFEIFDLVTEKLKGQRILDFSEYEDRIVGLPFNLHFTVREDTK